MLQTRYCALFFHVVAVLADNFLQAPGQQVIPTTLGIMAHSVPTLRLVLKSLLSQEQWLGDPYVAPLPWRDPEGRRPKVDTSSDEIAFGLMKADDIVTPHPPVARALNIVEQALQEAGHKVSLPVVHVGGLLKY